MSRVVSWRLHGWVRSSRHLFDVPVRMKPIILTARVKSFIKSSLTSSSSLFAIRWCAIYMILQKYVQWYLWEFQLQALIQMENRTLQPRHRGRPWKVYFTSLNNGLAAPLWSWFCGYITIDLRAIEKSYISEYGSQHKNVRQPGPFFVPTGPTIYT